MNTEITREHFCDIFESIENHDLIYKIFENETLFHTDTFTFINVDGYGDVTILKHGSLDHIPEYINWYKLYHLGRSLHVHGLYSDDEIKDFLTEVIEELKEHFTPKEKTPLGLKKVETFNYQNTDKILDGTTDVNSLYPSIIRKDTKENV